MMKLYAEIPNKEHVIVLGLSDGNVERLMEDDPIVFPLSDLITDDLRNLCITFKKDDGTAAVPDGLNGFALAFSQRALDDDMTGGRYVSMKYEEFQFYIVRGATEASLRKQFEHLIGPGTKVSDTSMKDRN